MSKPQFFVTPGAGEFFRKELHFSSAVRVGNRVETSGHGGWNSDLQIPEALADEIAAAFGNTTLALRAAGASWDDVIHVNTYHVGGFPPVVNETIVALYRKHMPDHAPIWTQVGVEALGLPTMHFEMRVTAIVD